MALAKLPWLRPGVVVHEPSQPIDDLLAQFALSLRDRGFSVAGYVQRNNLGCQELGYGCAPNIELQDLATDRILTVDPYTEDDGSLAAAIDTLGRSARDGADLVVVSRFSAFEKADKAVGGMTLVLAQSVRRGTPVLTSVTGRCLQKWHGLVERGGAMITPDIQSIWRWWGADRLYQDLTLGASDQEVRRIVCGPRWIMVETCTGTGLAYLPRAPKDLLPRLPKLERMSLRGLADLVHSWDPLEMALGIAAINAHYNRYDLDGAAGNGADAFRNEFGRVIVVGAFPGLNGTLPNAIVIETDPRPGELPTIAMDVVIPGSSAVVVTSNTLINRKLPRILQLAEDARVALIGPATPLTSRLHDYGVEVLGGLIVHNTIGLAAAIQAGAPPKTFTQYGRYVHVRGEGNPGRDSAGSGVPGVRRTGPPG